MKNNQATINHAEVTTLYFHWTQHENQAQEIGRNFNLNQEKQNSARMANREDINFLMVGSGEIIEGIIELQDGFYIYDADQDDYFKC